MRDNVKDTRCSLKRRLEDMALGASVVTISATNNRANASLLLIYRTDPFPVVLDLNGNNEVVMAYVSEAGIDRPIERIAFINGTPRNRQVFHADALGAVVALTDENGEPVQTYTYAAFGSIRTQTGTDLNRVTYTDRETLGDALGFYYYRYRVYDPNVGRFTSEDPLGFLDGPNMYLYCHNNPVSLVDPLGLIVTWDDIKDDPEKIMMYCTPICGVPEMQNASGLALTGGMVSGNLIMGEWLQAVWNIFQDWLTGKIRQQCEDNP